jgi:hypothetical protein
MFSNAPPVIFFSRQAVSAILSQLEIESSEGGMDPGSAGEFIVEQPLLDDAQQLTLQALILRHWQQIAQKPERPRAATPSHFTRATHVKSFLSAMV